MPALDLLRVEWVTVSCRSSRRRVTPRHRPDQGLAPSARLQMARDAGRRHLDNMQLGANEYAIRVKELAAGVVNCTRPASA